MKRNEDVSLKNDLAIAKQKFMIAESYVNAVKVMINDIIDNDDSVVGQWDSGEKEVDIGTKYHNVKSLILPILLCFYQSTELILKGFIYLHDKGNFSHDASKLFEKFKGFYSDEIQLIELLNKYVGTNMHGIIKKYMEENGLKTINELYNSLRYCDANGSEMDYKCIKYAKEYLDFECLYKGEYSNTMYFADELLKDISEILRLSIKLYRNIEKETLEFIE